MQILSYQSSLSAKDCKFYQALWDDQASIKYNIKAILKEYMQNDSAALCFLHGYWQRHHIKEVREIKGKIDKQSLEKLFFELHLIVLKNPNGSFAKARTFISNKITEELKTSGRSVTYIAYQY